MLYGSETRTVMKRHESRLGATEMAYLRRVVGVTRSDRVRNADVRETVNQEGVMEKVRGKQRAWKEKLEQMEDDRLVKKVYTEEIAGKRPEEDRERDGLTVSSNIQIQIIYFLNHV